jgi:hypothetical protein
MHLTPASSRALFAMPALLLALAAAAAPPPPAVAPAATASTAALLEVGKARIRGSVVATARLELSGGDVALLVAAQARPKAPVSFVLLVIGADRRLEGSDEVRAGALFGAPVVALAAGAPDVASGAITATVGWKAEDGSAEEQRVLYRQGAGRLTRLFAMEPDRRYGAASGRPGVRHALEVLPTSTAGFRDVLVRTQVCPVQGECAEPSEVSSWVFDGVRYVERPYAIPFIEKIVASSELESPGAITDYSAAAAVDGRADTAWCEGAPGAGWFQKLELSFVPAQKVRAISILPGGTKGDAFGDWTRPKRIRVLLPDDRKVEADLADEARPQRIELPAGERVFGLTVVIVDVVKGKSDAACINELGVEVEP